MCFGSRSANSVQKETHCTRLRQFEADLLNSRGNSVDRVLENKAHIHEVSLKRTCFSIACIVAPSVVFSQLNSYLRGVA